MSILLVIPNRNLDKLVIKFKALLPNVEIEVWPDVKQPELVEYIVAWQPPKGSLSPYTNCKAIASFGAGVDSILNYDGLPNVPVTRIVDANLAKDMSRYVLTHILAYQHRLSQYRHQQQQQSWKPKRALSANNVTILGAGQLGVAVAELLKINGFSVSLWSRQKKNIADIHCFDKAELKPAIGDADFIVNLLPLTSDTKGFLNNEFFSLVKEGCVLLNVARGDILDESSLIKILASGHLAHAILDVFSIEPLPKDHSFWQHPNITITPHCSALSDTATVTQQLADNFTRLQQGLPLLNVIDKDSGY